MQAGLLTVSGKRLKVAKRLVAMPHMKIAKTDGVFDLLALFRRDRALQKRLTLFDVFL